jgi:hypothetical protein
VTGARSHEGRPARSALAGAFLVVVLGLGWVTAARSPAQSATSSTTTSVPPASATPSMRLVSQSAWVGPIGTFQIRIGVATPPPGAQITARVYAPISTQAQLVRSAKGQALGQPIETETVPAEAVTRASDGSLDLDYPVVAAGSMPVDGFRLHNPGVYPFAVSVESVDGTQLDRIVTQLVRLPDSSSTMPAVAVTLVVPFGAPVNHQPDRTTTIGPAVMAGLTAETAALAAQPGVPLSVVPVPETIDSLAERDRTLGTHLVAGVRSAIGSRPTTGATYVSVDTGAWVAHGLTAGLDRQLVAGYDTVTTELASAPARDTLVSDATTTPEVLSHLYSRGVHTVVVASDALQPIPHRSVPNGPLTQWFDLASSNGDRLQAIPADSTLSAELTSGPDAVLDAHQVVAALALVSFDRSGSQACIRQPTKPCRRGVAVELPADAARAAPALDVLSAALADTSATKGATGAAATPLVAPVTVPQFLQQVDPASESGLSTERGARQLRHLAVHEVAALGTYPAHFQTVTADIDSFRTMVTPMDNDTGLGLVTAWNQTALSSGARTLSSSTAASYLDGVQSDLRSQTRQVFTLPQQIVTLTSASGSIPFHISNALDYPVRVVLQFQSAKLHFVNGARQVVTLPPRQPTTLEIEVRARASGAFPMQVTVTSPDGGLAVAQTKFDVRSTAVSGVGLVLTVAAGLFVLLWWARHFRDARRARRLVASRHPVLRK